MLPLRGHGNKVEYNLHPGRHAEHPAGRACLVRPAGTKDITEYEAKTLAQRRSTQRDCTVKENFLISE
jgi:hypothetical protein